MSTDHRSPITHRTCTESIGLFDIFIQLLSVMNKCRGMLLSQRPLLQFLRQQVGVQFQHNFDRRYMGHTVRIIITDDVSAGKLYAGEIANVRAGYARNFLIPQKKAIYATRQNFLKLAMKDPELETADERFARLSREASGDDQDVKAADILRKYLSNKMLKLWRNVDLATGADYNAIKPGMVDAKAVRQKLNKQLKISLEPHERVHIYKEQVEHDEVTPNELAELVMNDELFGVENRELTSNTEIKTLGQYVARICLRGGLNIPLKFEIMKR